MDNRRTAAEELAFRAAELDNVLRAAGFHVVFTEPEAARDFSYRARYLRPGADSLPPLSAYLEYYVATKAYSLKIDSTDDRDRKTFRILVKNHQGDLQDLLKRYFASVAKGLPLKIEEK